MKKIYVYIFILSFVSACERDNCPNILIKGHVKEAINNEPLDSVKVKMGYGYCEGISCEQTYTNEKGFFKIDYDHDISRDDFFCSVLCINAGGHHDWKPYVYNYSISKYTNYSCSDIRCGDEISKEIILYPISVIKLYFYTDKTLSSNDSLYYNYKYINASEGYYSFVRDPFNIPDNPVIDTMVVNANKKIIYEWKYKKLGDEWVTHSDTIVCKPFKVMEDTLYY